MVYFNKRERDIYIYMFLFQNVLGVRERIFFWMKRGTCWGKVLDDGWIDVG